MIFALTQHSEAKGVVMVFLVISIVLLIRLAAGSMDRDRIRRYIEGRGGSVLDIHWDPFGPGWFGSKDERIYAVSYRDGHGITHDVHCKTGMWSGVYFTNDN